MTDKDKKVKARAIENEYAFSYDDRSVTSAYIIHAEALSGKTATHLRKLFKGLRGDKLLHALRSKIVAASLSSAQQARHAHEARERHYDTLILATFDGTQGNDENVNELDAPDDTTSIADDEIPSEILSSIQISSQLLDTLPRIYTGCNGRLGRVKSISGDQIMVEWNDGGSTKESMHNYRISFSPSVAMDLIDEPVNNDDGGYTGLSESEQNQHPALEFDNNPGLPMNMAEDEDSAGLQTGLGDQLENAMQFVAWRDV